MKRIRMFFLKIIILYLLPIELFSQAPNTLWTKTFGDTSDDIGTGVLETNNGDFIICGYYYINLGWYIETPLIVRTNSIGDTIWSKKNYLKGNFLIPSPPVYEYEDGNIIIGTLRNGGLLKINSEGDSLNWKLFHCYSFSFDVTQTTLYNKLWGDKIIFGEVTQTDCSHYSRIYLHEISYNTDSTNLVWFIEPTMNYFNNFIQNRNRDVIVLGTDGPRNKLLLSSVDNATGNTLWSKNIGNFKEDQIWGKSLTESLNKGFMVLAHYFYDYSNPNICLIKTNDVGDSLYSNYYGGDGYDVGEYITTTSDGGYIIVGSTDSYGSGKSDVWLLKTDEYGDTLWTKTIGGTEDDYGVYVQQTSDKGYIVVGTTYSYGNGGSDIWLIRLGSDPTSVKNEHPYLKNFMVYQNYPHPFNASTKISWQSPVRSWQTLKVYDVLGNEVATLIDEFKPAGIYEIEFNAEKLTSGVYFYQLKAANFMSTKKMILLK